MTAFSTWGTYNHVSLIQLEWSLNSSIEELKIYVKLITEQMSAQYYISCINKENHLFGVFLPSPDKEEKKKLK